MIKFLPIKMVFFAAMIFNIQPAEAQSRKHPVVRFHEIESVASDTFRIEVKVTGLYECPPCPEGAQCKPCIGDYILVKENKGDETLRVFTRTPGKFTVGKPYVLAVRSRSTDKKMRRQFLELVKIE